MRWYGPIDDDSWTGRLRLNRERMLAWSAFLGRFNWEIFVTLTFDPRRVFPVGRELADREAFHFCKEVARLTRRPIGWAYVVERGKGGCWHAHVILIGLGKAVWTGALESWRNRNGSVDARPVYAGDGVALYTSKSVVLSGEVILSDTLRRYCQNLSKAATVRLYRGETAQFSG
jgi:hypothetical protein